MSSLKPQISKPFKSINNLTTRFINPFLVAITYHLKHQIFARHENVIDTLNMPTRWPFLVIIDQFVVLTTTSFMSFFLSWTNCKCVAPWSVSNVRFGLSMPHICFWTCYKHNPITQFSPMADHMADHIASSLAAPYLILWRELGTQYIPHFHFSRRRIHFFPG